MEESTLSNDDDKRENFKIEFQFRDDEKFEFETNNQRTRFVPFLDDLCTFLSTKTITCRSLYPRLICRRVEGRLKSSWIDLICRQIQILSEDLLWRFDELQELWDDRSENQISSCRFLTIPRSALAMFGRESRSGGTPYWSKIVKYENEIPIWDDDHLGRGALCDPGKWKSM
jgi:hypothetical protein